MTKIKKLTNDRNELRASGSRDHWQDDMNT